MDLIKNIKGFLLASSIPIVSLESFQIWNWIFSNIFGSYAIWYWDEVFLIAIVVYAAAIFLGIPAILFLKIFRIKNVFWYIFFGIIVGIFSTIFVFIPNVSGYAYPDLIAKVYLLKTLFSIGGLMGGMSGYCYWYVTVKF